MSKNKGDILEDTVALIEQSISGENTTIETRKKLVDRDGIKREIDVFIQTVVNKKKVGIAIECKNYKSGISIEKIEAFNDKCNSISVIDKKIFVTASTYQTGAITKASKCGIDLYLAQHDLENRVAQVNNVTKCILFKQPIKIKKLFFEINGGLYLYSTAIRLFANNESSLSWESIEEKLMQDRNVKSILRKYIGCLVNTPKEIFLMLKVSGVKADIRNNIFDVTQLFLRIETQFLCIENNLSSTLKYVDLQEPETPIANYSEANFQIDSSNIKISIVESDGEENFFITENDNKIEKLNHLGTIDKFELGSKDFSHEKLPVIPIKVYTREVSDKVINDENISSDSTYSNKAAAIVKKEGDDIMVYVDYTSKELGFMT